jgi:hypothetical protein
MRGSFRDDYLAGRSPRDVCSGNSAVVTTRLPRKDLYSDGFGVIKGRHQNHHIASA